MPVPAGSLRMLVFLWPTPELGTTTSLINHRETIHSKAEKEDVQA